MDFVIWEISGMEVSLPGEPDIQQKFMDALFLLHIINQSWEKPLTALLITQIRE